MSESRTSPRLLGYRDAMAERGASPLQVKPGDRDKYLAGYQAGTTALAEEVRRASQGLRLTWEPAEEPGQVLWTAGGRDVNYLVAPGGHGDWLLCRWDPGHGQMLACLAQACRTLLHVPTAAEGRRIAQEFEAGLDIEGEPAWAHGYVPGAAAVSPFRPELLQ